MVTKELSVALDPPQYQTGWYRDATTGAYCYYDAPTGQWYIYTAGYLVPLTIINEPAPKVIDISPGDTLRVSYSYQYCGPAITVTEYVSIGVYGIFGYNDQARTSRTRNLPATDVSKTFTGSLDLLLPPDTKADWNDIECKVYNGGQELGKRVIDALNIVEEVTYAFTVGSPSVSAA